MNRLVISGGTVIDGTGAAPARGDVVVEDGRIVEVVPLSPETPQPQPTSRREGGVMGEDVVDATGMYVAPGFIDAHIHTDIQLLTDPQQEASLRQGVTTHIIGQDGISFAPASPATMTYMRDYFGAINTIPELDWNWSSVAGFIERLSRRTAVNFGYLVPHGNLRLEALGLEDRTATADELRKMKDLAMVGMEEGAIGFSTGLDYLPGAYGDTNELIEIARTIAAQGGVYVTHMRMNRLGLEGSMKEAFDISRASGCPLHISHLNGRGEVVMPLLEQAQNDGIDLTFESYCYLASCTILAMHALPEWVQEGGPATTIERLGETKVRERLREWFEMPERGLDQLQMTCVPGHEVEEGLRVTEAAERAGMSVTDFVCDRLIETRMQICAIGYQGTKRTEQDMVDLMVHPAHMAGSDGIFSGGKPHPRGYGCFARYLAYHTRTRGDYDWAQAIWHLSGHAAERFGLNDRGKIQKGFAADIVVFDPLKIQDHATFEHGAQYATGVEHVFVNGQVTLKNGQVTGTYAGRGLVM